MTCCTEALFCYHDVTPCVVAPTQTTAALISAGLWRHTFDAAATTNRDGTVFATGSVPNGSAIITNQNAADRLHDQNYGGGAGTIFRGGANVRDVQFDLTFDVPHDRVQSFAVLTGYGSVLNDSDGCATGVTELNFYDEANNLIAGPILMNAANSGARHLTPIPGAPLTGVKRVTADQFIRWGSLSGPFAIREMELLGGYHSTATWQCGGATLTGLIQGEQAGITIVGGNLAQTNGPHTITFSSTGSEWSANIITNNPGMFSSLTADPLNPTVTISGNGTASFTVEFVIPTPVRRARMDLSQTPPAAYDLMTGEQMAEGQYIPVACGDV